MEASEGLVTQARQSEPTSQPSTDVGEQGRNDLVNAGSRLALNVLVWAVSIPIISVGLTALDRIGLLPLSGILMAISVMALVLWGTRIYLRCVPSRPRVVVRIAYFTGFLITMIVLGSAAGWVAFGASAAILGH
jgi:hypothetical protein